MRAIINYSKAIDIDTQSAQIYNNRGRPYFQYLLGNALMEMGRKEDAIIDFSMAIKINPHY